MNLTVAKTVLWTGTLAVLGTLGWVLKGYLENRPEQAPSRASLESQEKWLKGIEPPPEEARDLVKYKDGVLPAFRELNWIGKPPPPPPPPPTPEQTGPRVIPVDDVATLLEVLFIQVDGRGRESQAFVRWIQGDLVKDGEETTYLMEGDRLPGKYDYWQVASIRGDGVVFTYTGDDDREVEDQTAMPPDPLEGDSPLIVRLGPGDEILEPSSELIPQASEDYSIEWPTNTLEISTNRFRIGTEDSARIGEDYTEILATEIRTRRYRNPATGKYQGFELTSVSPGGVLSQHGAKQGDVVISINGNPVNSVNEAISFAKQNQDLYKTWNVVVLNAGKERTITYEVE